MSIESITCNCEDMLSSVIFGLNNRTRHIIRLRSGGNGSTAWMVMRWRAWVMMVRWLLMMWAGLRWGRSCCWSSCSSCSYCAWRRRWRGSSMRSSSMCLRSSCTCRWRRSWIMLLMRAWMVLGRRVMMVMMTSSPWLLGLLLSRAMAMTMSMSMRITHTRRSCMMMMARGSSRLWWWSRCFWMRLWGRLLWAMPHLRGRWWCWWMVLIMRVWMWWWGLYCAMRLSCIMMSFIWCSRNAISLLFIRCPSVSSWWWGWLFRRSRWLHNFF